MPGLAVERVVLDGGRVGYQSLHPAAFRFDDRIGSRFSSSFQKAKDLLNRPCFLPFPAMAPLYRRLDGKVNDYNKRFDL
jgi:hypothetical protein